ncbi:MAG: DUF2723 domain-containing protein [Acidobacteria bacterium]|nr:DUF2723 domain-containing protein [Acidobacteriota bacterium]
MKHEKVKQNQKVKFENKNESNKETNKLESAPLLIKKDAIICAGIFFISILVYILTLAPAISFGDSGELTAAAYNLGIAHPPGYPLYLMLGKLFMLLIPFGDMAVRMNLLSAFFASLTAVVIYLIGRILTFNRLMAVSTSLMAAFSFTFWTQAVTTEVYTLAALFFSALIFFTLQWLKNRQNRWLLSIALTGGLALTHHVIIAVFYPVFLFVILVTELRLLKDWKLVVKLIVIFLLPLLLYLYLPIRSAANPPNDWGNPDTFSRMIDHITARQFGSLFFKHGMAGMMYQWHILFDALLKQFPSILLILAISGFITGLKRETKITFFLIALLAMAAGYASAYYITDIESHFTYIFIVLVLFMGIGLNRLWQWFQRFKKVSLQWTGTGILLLIALLPLIVNWSKCDKSDNYLARNYGRNMINFMEPNGILFIDNETELFIAAYIKMVEGLRPDVEVYDIRQNIFYLPAAKKQDKKNITISDLYNFVLQVLSEKKPVYFCNPIFANFKFLDYGVLYRAVPMDIQPENIKMEDPWEKYDLKGLERANLDAAEKETAGKYYFARGRYLMKMKQEDSARTFMEKAFSVAGGCHLIMKNMGIFYMQTGKYDDAKNVFTKAVKIYPFDSDDFNALAMIDHYRSDYKSALDNYDKALSIKKNNISALMNRGMLYEQMGDKEKDIWLRKDYYEKALIDSEESEKIEPSNPAILQIKNRISHKLR